MLTNRAPPKLISLMSQASVIEKPTEETADRNSREAEEFFPVAGVLCHDRRTCADEIWAIINFRSKTLDSGSVKDLVSIGCQAEISNFYPPCEFEPPVKVNGLLQGTGIRAFTYIQKGSLLIDTDVGRFCSIAMNVSTGAGEHPVDWLSSHPFVDDPNDVAAGLSNCYPEYREWLTGAPGRVTGRGGDRVTIGSDVWIGEGAFIRRGVTIGTGAIVAAHAVVTKDVAPFSIVGGNPAKHIRYRIAEGLIDEVLGSRWWEFDLRPIIGGIDFSDVRASVTKINEAWADGRIERFVPPRYIIDHDGAKLI